jgi:N-acetylglucosaminyl-diphospho-decaprenol L-rhamnosyltransferase
MLRVALVTVTYRGGDEPLRWAAAVEAARAALPRDVAEVRAIAVDNASGDGTPERLLRAAPWVEVVQLPRNAGFAAGSNVGIRQAGEADVVVLVNPDVHIREDFLARLVRLPWPDDLGARGPCVIGPGSGIEQSARGFPRISTGLWGRTSLLARLLPSHRAARRELRADPAAGPIDVDWVSGACLVTPGDRFRLVGPLDEGYFMYWEDADWCRRARDRGLRIRYEPELVVHHHQGSSARSRPVATTIAFHRSALRYWRQHVARGRADVVLAAALLSARCCLKLAALTFRGARRRAGGGRSGARAGRSLRRRRPPRGTWRPRRPRIPPRTKARSSLRGRS